MSLVWQCWQLLLQELSDLKEEWSTIFAWLEALLTVGSNPLPSLSTYLPKELVLTLVKVSHPTAGVVSASPLFPHTVSSPIQLGSGTEQESNFDDSTPVDTQQA